MLKKYRISFEVWGLLVFLIVIIPNLIWLAVPAPNDIYRVDSATETVDAIASVCRVLMVAALCFLRNAESKKLCISPLIIIAAGCCLLYFANWIIYYTGIVNIRYGNLIIILLRQKVQNRFFDCLASI